MARERKVERSRSRSRLGCGRRPTTGGDAIARRARAAGWAVAALAVLALGACRGDGKPSPTPASPASQRAPRAPERIAVERPLMGTTFRIVVHAVDGTRTRAALDAAFAALAEVERWASDWDPSSEVRTLATRVEKAPPGAPAPVSAALADHLAFALDVAARTDGAYDPTLGTLTRLWRRSARLGERPTPERLAAARAAAGFRHVALDRARREVRIASPGLRFDLGGSAKGEALDRALAVLAAHGLPHALVEGGGDLALGAAPPGERGWSVELRPLGVTGPRLGFTAARCGIATSGDAEQRVVLDGVSHSHVVDPATGLGLTARHAATVIARDARTADALATALVVRGEAGLALTEGFPGVAAALFVPPAIGDAAGGEPEGTVARPACASAGFPHDGGHATALPPAPPPADDTTRGPFLLHSP